MVSVLLAVAIAVALAAIVGIAGLLGGDAGGAQDRRGDGDPVGGYGHVSTLVDYIPHARYGTYLLVLLDRVSGSCSRIRPVSIVSLIM